LDPTKKKDCKEAYNVGNENERQKFGEENLFPNDFPKEEKKEICDFFETCNTLLMKFLSALELSLELKKNFFVDAHSSKVNMLRLLCYPPVSETENYYDVRAGEHVDYGSATLLFRRKGESEIDGLQVLNENKEFIDAPFIDGTILINLGELLERWTNGHYKATVHRVCLPPKANSARYSIAYFGHPNYETVISNLIPNEQPRYDPIGSLEFLLQKLKKTY